VVPETIPRAQFNEIVEKTDIFSAVTAATHSSAYDTGRVQREHARVHSRSDCAGKHGPVRRLERLLGLQGYVHDRQVQRHQEEGEHLLPRVHRVIALLKRWLLGTHQGAIGQRHLDDYLDEFTLRFNRRKSKSRGELFYRLAQQVVHVGPVPFATLIKPQPVVSGGVK